MRAALLRIRGFSFHVRFATPAFGTTADRAGKTVPLAEQSEEGLPVPKSMRVVCIRDINTMSSKEATRGHGQARVKGFGMMVARLTKEDRLQRVAKKLRQRVDKNSSQTQSLHHCPSSILGVQVREAGYERTGAKMLDDLDKRLKAVGVGSFPELTDPSVNRKTRIHFFDLFNIDFV